MEEAVNYAARWAEFAGQVEFADLPADVVRRMKRSLLDALGCAIIGSRYESCRQLGAYLRSQGGVGEATVIPHGYRTSGLYAAFVNGSHMGATELAESFTRATMHCGNVVPPVALAAGERQASTGRELLAAMAIGYEIAIRTGLSIRVEPDSPTFAAKDENRPGGPLGPTYISHPVSTFGLPATAATAAKLLRLDEARTAQAIVLSTTLTPTIGRAAGFFEGASAKDLYVGFSNGVGVLSADLAGAGITGGPDVLNHLQTLVHDMEPSLLDWRLGDEWLTCSGGLHFKLHMLSGMTQPAAEAVLDLLRQRDLQPDAIERIDVRVPERGIRQSADQTPATITAAAVSIPYVVAALIAFQDQFAADPYFSTLHAQAVFEHPSRRELSRRVFVHADDEITAGFERQWPMTFASRIDVELKTGEHVRGEAEIWSTSSNLPDDALIEKFRDLGRRVLPADKVERAIDLVFTLDEGRTVEELVRAVCI